MLSCKCAQNCSKTTRPGTFKTLLVNFKHGFSLLCLTILYSYSQTVLALQTWQAPDYIEKAFYEIAFKNEYASGTFKVVKWHTPIRYQVEYRDMPHNPLLKAQLSAHLMHLEKITGLSISEQKSAINLNIIFTQKHRYKQDILPYTKEMLADKIADESHCMGNFQTNKRGEIAQGVIIIPVDHAFSKGLFVSCIVEETTQLLGLPNDSDWVHPSIANDQSQIELLTGLDYLLLKILYDTNLKAGMSKAISQPIIKKRIAYLKQTRQIENATKLVNQDGLNALFK